MKISMVLEALISRAKYLAEKSKERQSKNLPNGFFIQEHNAILTAINALEAKYIIKFGSWVDLSSFLFFIGNEPDKIFRINMYRLTIYTHQDEIMELAKRYNPEITKVHEKEIAEIESMKILHGNRLFTGLKP